MTEYLKYLLLGVVQGLCEFLPVSSSGHLILTEKLLGVSENMGGAFFNVMLHGATLIAVCIVYRRQLLAILKKPFQKLTGYLILATLPTVSAALLFKKVGPFDLFYGAAEEGMFLGISFLLTSVFLLLTDMAMKGKEKRTLKQMNAGHALGIGLMQAVGVFPGVSRSGSTVAGASFCGLDRSSAADFSFLMSVPAILGSLVLALKDALEEGSMGVGVPELAIGMVAAGVTGFFAVKWMLRLIKKKKLWGFAVYTGLLGIAVICLQYKGIL